MANVDGNTNPADGLPRIRWPDDYWKSLVQFVRVETKEPPLGLFGTLQTTNITHLLNEIAIIKSTIEHNQTVSPEEMEHLRVVLHKYANAVRDYKFLKELERQPEIMANEKWMSLMGAFNKIDKPYGERNRPYHTEYLTLQPKRSTERDSVREFLRLHLPKELSWPYSEISERGSDYSRGLPPDGYSRLVDAGARFIVGMFGGCALIVPMLVMVFHPSLTKSIVTVCVALVLFALTSGLVFQTNNRETITATATYAAVLVVFVGTSGTGGSGN